MEGTCPNGVEIDPEWSENFVVRSDGLEMKELFAKVVLVHHKVEGVVSFPLILISRYICFSLGVNLPQRYIETGGPLQPKVETYHFLNEWYLTVLHFLTFTSEIST